MRRSVIVMIIVLAAASVTAEELTIGMILSAQRAGADASGLVKMINDPAYTTIKVKPTDLETLKAAGVPPEAIAALQARMPAPTPVPAASRPDDARLVDIARLTKSGLSETLITEQIRSSNQAFDLSVNDLVYLKENDVSDAVIKELLATKAKTPAAAPAAAPVAPAAAPVAVPVVAPVAVPVATPVGIVANADVVVTNLVLMKPTFLKKNRSGRLVVKQEEIEWIDGDDASENFHFKVGGIEKMWFSCLARGTTNFCFQLNIKIAKGPTHRFQDSRKESGYVEAVQQLEQIIKSRFPTVLVAEPNIDN